ncbi:MAG TPA: YciI family protein [Actinomycetota bacterium]|nr:YciI family protein [Actinomycetota bacterium]
MPRYVALIYGSEAGRATASPEDVAMMMKAYGEYTEAIQTAGVFDGGDGLQPTSTATTVRVRGGEVSTTDGPFAETKEALGGFYVFKCKDLDEAIEWAAKIPGASFGSIEVRPVIEFPEG